MAKERPDENNYERARAEAVAALKRERDAMAERLSEIEEVWTDDVGRLRWRASGALVDPGRDE